MTCMNANVEPLDYQQIRGNSLITLRVKALKHLNAKRGDWVAILPGEGGSIVIKKINHIEFDYGDSSADKD